MTDREPETQVLVNPDQLFTTSDCDSNPLDFILAQRPVLFPLFVLITLEGSLLI